MKSKTLQALSDYLKQSKSKALLSSMSIDLLSKVLSISPTEAKAVKTFLQDQSTINGLMVHEPDPDLVTDPGEVYCLAHPLITDPQKEHFIVFLLDNRNQVIRSEVVSVGTLNMSLVHPREVYRSAVTVASASILVCHNHPAGDCEPSSEDKAITDRLKRAGELLGIPLLDHVIMGNGRYTSLKERGLV